jgi:GTP-binding protein
MKSLKAEFKLSAVDPKQFPNTQFPEIAFSGRSNVGKSSLLNNLVGSKKVAKTSSTPGKTQQINFFLVDDKWMFADLPGFGYAKIAKTEREKWLKLNMSYLSDREQLKITFLLIDSRHDPMESDITMMEWLENHEKPFAIILTKCDKIPKKMVEERHEQVKALLANCKFNVDTIPHSSETGNGRDSIIGMIKRIC